MIPGKWSVGRLLALFVSLTEFTI
jgi:hypothetical protein